MEYTYKPTTHGRAVMAACMALEKPFHVTRVAFGSGKVEEDTNLADVHELLEYVADGAAADRSHKDDRFCLTIQYANSEHKDVKTFLLSEFIVYGEDPATGAETDLIYGSLGDYRQPVPAYNPAYPPSVFNFPLEIILSDEINVSISAPAGLVTHAELTVLIDAMAVRRTDIIIPASGWVEAGGGRYPCRLDIPLERVAERLIPSLTVLPDGLETACACGLAPTVQTLDGALRVFAAAVPAEDIPASLTLQGDASAFCRVGIGGDAYSLPPATADSLGAVKPGDGLRVAKDGTLSVDAASDAEVNEMLAGEFPDNK